MLSISSGTVVQHRAAKALAAAVLVALSVWGCSNVRGRTTQMFPDCTQVSAEQQRQGKCMNRPDLPDGL